MGSSSVPNLKGTNAFFSFFLEGGSGGLDKLVMWVKSWEIGPDVTKIADGVNGEDRDQLDRSINSFSGNAVTFMKNSKALIEKLLSDIDNDDALVAPLMKGVGLNIKPADGTKETWACTEVVIDDWKWASAGRTDRQLVTIPWRCRYMKSAKSV